MKFNYHSASKQELQAQFKKIAAITQDGVYKPKFFGLPIPLLGMSWFSFKPPLKKALFNLPKRLTHTEEILAFCSGVFDGSNFEVVVLTNEHLIIMDRSWGLSDEKIILLTSIESIEKHTPFLGKGLGIGNIIIKADKIYQLNGVASATIELFVACVNKQLAVIKQTKSEQIP